MATPNACRNWAAGPGGCGAGLPSMDASISALRARSNITVFCYHGVTRACSCAGHQFGDRHPAANVQVLGGGRDRVLDHRAAAGDRHEPLVSLPRRAVFDERGHEREHVESGGARAQERLGHLRQGRVEDLAPGRLQVVGLAELRDTMPVPLLPRFTG
jgi:hypothetical protein